MSISSVLVPAAPFSWPLTLEYLRTSPSAVVERITDSAYERAVPLEGRPVLLRLESAGAGVRLSLHGPEASAAQFPAAERLARRLLHLDAHTAALEGDVAGDPVFAALAARYRGLRPVLIADPFESLVWAILGQQINVIFAAKLKRALVEGFGTALTVAGHTYHLFPEAERLAGLTHERDLRPLQFSRQKSEYTILAARAVAGGALDLAALAAAGEEEALARLMALKGVGRWTAEYVLMRGLGFPDVLPAGDGGLRRIIGRAYGYGRLATEAEVRAIAAAWRPWRSYAQLHLWQTLSALEDLPDPEEK